MKIYNRIRQKLKCNKGASFPIAVAVIFLGMAVFMVALMFLNITQNYSAIRKEVNSVLNVHIVRYERELSDTVKSGSGSFLKVDDAVNTNVRFDTQAFKQDVRKSLGIDTSGQRYYKDGGLKFAVADIAVKVVYGNELKAHVTYDVEIPIYFMGKSLWSHKSTVNISTKQNNNFENITT